MTAAAAAAVFVLVSSSPPPTPPPPPTLFVCACLCLSAEPLLATCLHDPCMHAHVTVPAHAQVTVVQVDEKLAQLDRICQGVMSKPKPAPPPPPKAEKAPEASAQGETQGVKATAQDGAYISVIVGRSTMSGPG